jgi:hypothetical protein
MICDGRGCSVIAHLNCYFSAGSKDANDTISDIEHWHCENCGGLPRHMHPRPRAAKRARVSFDPDLAVVTDTLITKGGFATGHQGGGWGGHWPTRIEMPQLTTGKGKEAMEPPIITSKKTLQALSASLTLQPDQDTVVETTTCHFCRRADLWLYFTCAVCQLTTHAKCYYRLGSDEAAYYETNTPDWRCQDCGGPQRHGDCVLPSDGLIRHAGFRQPYGDHPALGDMSQAAGGRGKEPLPQKLNELPDVGITNLDILDSLIPRPPPVRAVKRREKKQKKCSRTEYIGLEANLRVRPRGYHLIDPKLHSGG